MDGQRWDVFCEGVEYPAVSESQLHSVIEGKSACCVQPPGINTVFHQNITTASRQIPKVWMKEKKTV